MTILLLDVPGLHLGYLGFYGNVWAATPNLDHLASQSVVFDRHYAAGPDSLVTGRYRFPHPDEPEAQASGSPARHWFADQVAVKFHLIEPNPAAAVFDKQVPRLLQKIVKTLAKADEQTLVWARLPSLAPPWKLSKGLLEECFEEGTEANLWLDPPQRLPEAPPGTPITGEELERLQDTYAAAVAFLDEQLGGLVEDLAERGLLDRLLLVLTSNRGLCLGEHGWIGNPRAWQHEELVHLPFLARFPEVREAGLRVGALTQSVDILPTLAEHLGIAAEGLQGQSLEPLIRQDVAAIRPYAASADQFGGSVEWSLRSLEWAYLLPLSTPAEDGSRASQLYVKPADRWEVNDVRQHHPECVEEMEKALREFAGQSAKKAMSLEE